MSFIPVMAKLNFQHHCTSLQSHNNPSEIIVICWFCCSRNTNYYYECWKKHLYRTHFFNDSLLNRKFKDCIYLEQKLFFLNVKSIYFNASLLNTSIHFFKKKILQTPNYRNRLSDCMFPIPERKSILNNNKIQTRQSNIKASWFQEPLLGK